MSSDESAPNAVQEAGVEEEKSQLNHSTEKTDSEFARSSAAAFSFHAITMSRAPKGLASGAPLDAQDVTASFTSQQFTDHTPRGTAFPNEFADAVKAQKPQQETIEDQSDYSDGSSSPEKDLRKEKKEILKIQPSWELPIEVYDEVSGYNMIDRQFTNSIKIRTLAHIGSGGQAKVYKSQLTTQNYTEGIICVCKMISVLNNEPLAAQTFQQMFKEFSIGCKLRHPGIIEYMYFVRRDSPKMGKREQEFHIIMELMEGGNLQQYLDQMPKKREVNIQRVRDIATQIL